MTFDHAFAIGFYSIMSLLMVSIIIWMWTWIWEWVEKRL